MQRRLLFRRNKEERALKVIVAGASGAIGQPLISELIGKGHTVAGMTLSDDGAKRLREYGVEVAIANAFDKSAVEAALRASNVEAVGLPGKFCTSGSETNWYGDGR
jgi:nucleoside-diphosphate-sugar epimerase